MENHKKHKHKHLLLFPFYGEWTEYLVAFTDRQESADQGQRASDWLFIMGLPM